MSNFFLPFLLELAELRKQMVYYTALPLIMKSENGGPTQLCLNQNQIMMNDSGAFNGSPSSQQAQLINLQNGDINGASPSHQQQNNYTYQLLTSVDHQQLQQNSQQLHQQQQQQQQPQQTPQQQNVPQMQSVNNGRVPKQTKSFKCDQCNMNFGSKSAHTSHIKSHAKQLQQQQSPSSSLASSNLSSVNSGSSNTTQMQSSDPYQCDVCKKTFAVPARLVRFHFFPYKTIEFSKIVLQVSKHFPILNFTIYEQAPINSHELAKNIKNNEI